MKAKILFTTFLIALNMTAFGVEDHLGNDFENMKLILSNGKYQSNFSNYKVFSGIRKLKTNESTISLRHTTYVIDATISGSGNCQIRVGVEEISRPRGIERKVTSVYSPVCSK